MVYRIGLVGYGIIARAQHLPAIANNPDFELTAIASHGRPAGGEGVRIVTSAEELLESPEIDAVALCTPPGIHYLHASLALRAGKHVLLEKPPTATLGEAQTLLSLADKTGRVLFASWHSQFNPSIKMARAILDQSAPKTISVIWHEDVTAHHVGQDWIWQPGGFGVFDAGINALSMLSKLLPERVIVQGADMVAGPGNKMPIAAKINAISGDASLTLDFDWRVHKSRREISIVTHDGRHLFMPASGRELWVDGVERLTEEKNEYPRLYQHFSQLLGEGRSDADFEPLRMVADSFLIFGRNAS